MTRPRFYPCQTEDGRTYVMRSNGIGEPTINREISGSFDTTERWRIAKKFAQRMNDQQRDADKVAALFWRIVLAFLALAAIVAAFTWGL